MNLRYKETDGGRRDAGFKGHTGDCGTRAVAIALGRGYRDVYSELTQATIALTGGLERSVRNGTSRPVMHMWLTEQGWRLVLTPKAYLTAEHVPMHGAVIAVLGNHYCAVIDGTVMDSWDSRKSRQTKNGAPTLQGFYRAPPDPHYTGRRCGCGAEATGADAWGHPTCATCLDGLVQLEAKRLGKRL